MAICGAVDLLFLDQEDFVFGGERIGMQVLSNSFVPTLLCVYVIYARSGLSSKLYGRIPYQESRDDRFQ